MSPGAPDRQSRSQLALRLLTPEYVWCPKCRKRIAPQTRTCGVRFYRARGWVPHCELCQTEPLVNPDVVTMIAGLEE